MSSCLRTRRPRTVFSGDTIARSESRELSRKYDLWAATTKEPMAFKRIRRRPKSAGGVRQGALSRQFRPVKPFCPKNATRISREVLGTFVSQVGTWKLWRGLLLSDKGGGRRADWLLPNNLPRQDASRHRCHAIPETRLHSAVDPGDVRPL